MLVDLLRAEVVRLRYRRRATWSVLLMVLIGVLLPTQWMPNAQPLTSAEIAEARAWLQSDTAAGYCPDGCTLDQYLRTVLDFEDVARSVAESGLFVAFVVFFIVVTYVGSDFASGALATQLTFTPRRPAVLAARTCGAALLGGALMTVATLTSSSVSIVWYLALHGFGSVGAGGGLLAAIWSASLYGMLLGAVGALLVFCLGGSALASGLAFLTLVAEVIVEGFSPTTPAWWIYHVSPVWQGQALLAGSPIYTAEYTRSDITRPEAIGYHLVVIALLATAALISFNRRDVRG